MVTKIIIVTCLFFLSMGAFSSVMNLNELTPTMLEDATPVDEKSHVLLLSTAFDKTDQDEILFRPNYRYGANDRLQLEAQMDFESGGDEKSNGQGRLAALYELNKEEKYVPVIAINPMLLFPTGKSDSGLDTQIKFIASSTLAGSANSPDFQLHLNYSWFQNAQQKPDERRNYSEYAFGLSRKTSDSRALVADIIRMELLEANEEWNLAEAGIRQEVIRNSFLGFGMAAGFGDESPSWRAILSFETELH